MIKNDILFSRRSCRVFLDEPVSKEHEDYLISAFLQSPTAHNLRTNELVVIRDKKMISSIAALHHSKAIIKQAPLLFALISGRDYQTSASYRYLQQELGAATLQMLLAAEQLGLGSLWIGINETTRPTISACLNLPQDVYLVSIVLVGSKAETKEANNYFDQKKIHYEQY